MNISGLLEGWKIVKLLSMPTKIKTISQPPLQASLQIRKYHRAESNAEILATDTLSSDVISENTEINVRDSEVILNTSGYQENEPLQPQTYQNVDLARESLNPPGAILYQSGWEYGQLLKEFRCDY